MVIQLTAALSFIIALTIVWPANKDVDTTFSTPKTSHSYRKLDTSNVTTILMIQTKIH